jgi:hypothetical protein
LSSVRLCVPAARLKKRSSKSADRLTPARLRMLVFLKDLHDGAACRTDALRWPNSTEHALVTARNAEREIPGAQRNAKTPLQPKNGAKCAGSEPTRQGLFSESGAPNGAASARSAAGGHVKKNGERSEQSAGPLALTERLFSWRNRSLHSVRDR